MDIKNIGEVAAIVLEEFKPHKNQALEITGLKNANFEHVTSFINKTITNPLHYRKVNPITSYKLKKREEMAKGMIIVMILLHFLPKFQKAPRISTVYE